MADDMERVVGSVLPNLAVISLPMIVPNARSVLPTSSVTVLGFGSAESKLFLNFFSSGCAYRGLFQLEVVNILSR